MSFKFLLSKQTQEMQHSTPGILFWNLSCTIWLPFEAGPLWQDRQGVALPLIFFCFLGGLCEVYCLFIVVVSIFTVLFFTICLFSGKSKSCLKILYNSKSYFSFPIIHIQCSVDHQWSSREVHTEIFSKPNIGSNIGSRLAPTVKYETDLLHYSCPILRNRYPRLFLKRKIMIMKPN